MNKMQLYFKQPAAKWEECLPIGNGSLGGMILGGIKEETIGLNEESLWSGYKRDKNNKNAYENLDQVRQWIYAGEYGKAEQRIQETMLGEYNESYLPLGDLTFQFAHSEHADNYQRRLDLESSVATVSYDQDGVHYTREYFASFPDRAIFMKFTTDQPVMEFSMQFSSPLVWEGKPGENVFYIKGKCPEHVDPTYILRNENPIIQGTKGQEFHAAVKVWKCDGIVETGKEGIKVQKASQCIFMLSAVRKPLCEDGTPYSTIFERHTADYKSLYEKTELYLGDQKETPTDVRLKALKEGEEDNGLYSLYFQYGRYLLISSSREGSLPANLQGIWNWGVRPPWSSNWTTNINTQMNYWHAQSCNLSECLEPYFKLLERLCEEGKKTAAENYHCRGSVHHHNADYWCNTNPVGRAYGHAEGEDESTTWSMWPMGGAWLAQELFRHYEYNEDRTFLRETAYPIMKELSLFLVDWLVEHQGVYVTCPSISPENRFYTGKTEGGEKETSAVTMASAMDLEIIRELFGNFLETCRILEIEDEILPEIEERLSKLSPFQIGSFGQLLEWGKEFEEPEPGHRHISHLYGLFPSELFEGDEAMTQACKISLQHRLENGGAYTGWSCAWVVNMFAILLDGENAYQYLHTLLTRSSYDNLWDAHPPFQIDGNFGGTAGIANMLVQDRKGKLKILPALPKQFANGYVKGLCIKGKKAVDIKWKDGVCTSHTVYDR